MKRYSHMQFVDTSDPDAISQMIPYSGGDWVLASESQEKINDSQEKIDYLVSALLSLKHCNIKLTSADDLNDFVNSKLQGYL